jgi:Na+/melibiose symporter-like transporter
MRKGIAADLGSEGTTMRAHALDWRKRMSDTVAYSLLVYTSLQIFVTLRTLEGTGGSMLPMIALVVLVAGIIPMFRHFERRWERLSDAQAANPDLRPDFRRDQLATWAVAIGVPFLLAAVFRLLVSLF